MSDKLARAAVDFRRPLLATVAFGALLAAANGALAQTAPIETITVTAQRDRDVAASVAPTVAPLDAIQPTSVISQDFIEKNLPLSGNYDEAIKLAPSVSNVAPNGPGLAESQQISIRGFQDGQFNVTFDGIPWGDSNDFTHHTTSYFAAHDLGEISVDRGPGTAATIGNATFGGTVGVLSKAPSEEMSINPYVSFGSFNTQLYGVELDSGSIEKYGGTRIMLDGEGLTSDGYLTHMGQERENAFLKIVQPIGGSTVLTLVGMYNTLQQGISLGATAAQIAKFGPNFALSTNPNSQNFFGYNQDSIHTDFEYADINSDLGDGWNLNAKVYTYAYFHQGLNGEDPNGETPNGTSEGPNDVPGQLLQNDYRSIGTITRFKKDLPFGDVQFGLWYDHQENSRGLFEVDFSDNQAINTALGTNGVDRELHQDLDTIQPYLQFDWQPIEGLTISPGLRYSYFDRSVNSQVNVKTGAAQNYSNTFDAVLPSVAAHYLIEPNWSVYAQAAEGFLAPNENFFSSNNPSSTNLSPQQSWNYQIGTSWQTKQLAVSFDAYYIDFSNFIGSQTVGGITNFFNQGGAVYKGLEAEVTYSVGYGFNLYANGSINSAKDKQTGLWLQNAPNSTGALGVIYDQDGIYGSLIEKWVGSRFGDSAQAVGLDPYGTLDMALGYTLDSPLPGVGKTSIKLEMNNLLDTNKIFAFAGGTAADNTPLFWTIPGRSVFVTLSTSL